MEALFSSPYESVFFFLFLAAFTAGIVDAIAGGGGLITVPSMLLAGLPPLTVLGTNRMQSAIGELTSFITFWMNNEIRTKSLWLGAIATAIGATLGSYSVSLISADFLRTLLPLMMVAITLYSIFSKQMRDNIKVAARLSTPTFMITCGLSIGFYNGFFGPGVGSIWMLAFVVLLGLTLKDASISTKPLNLIGNVISLLFFIGLGSVDYSVGLIMGAGQIAGSFIGSKIVIKNGDRVVRPVFITVTTLMTLKLLYETSFSEAFASVTQWLPH